MEDLKNKKQVVLITGTRSGIGQGLAENFLRNDFLVLGCSRGDASLVHKNYAHFKVDITEPELVTKWIETIEKKYKNIDILINNVGAHLASPALLTPVEKVRSIMDTNFFSGYHLCREVAKRMVLNKFGRIVNISSIATSMMAENTTAYVSSKSALVEFSKIFAKEMAPFGITCNVVGISILATDMIKNLSDKAKLNVMSHLAIKRYASHEDIYRAVSFFSGRKNNYITGQVLNLGFL